LRIERFSARYVTPVSNKLASDLDSDIAGAIVNSTVAVASDTSGLASLQIQSIPVGVANSAGHAVGAYGTAITPSLVQYAKKVMLDQGAPDDGDIYGVVSTTQQNQLIAAQAQLFNPLLDPNALYRKGYLGVFDGIKFSYSQSLVGHVNGAQPTLVASAGNATSGWTETSNLTVTATGAAINAGDVFEFPGVYLVNPLTKTITDVPFQVQVITAAASGATSITVCPAPISGGPYQNISATVNGVTAQLTGSTLPGTAAVGSGAVGLSGIEGIIWHKQAIATVSPKLHLPPKGTGSEALLINDRDLDGFNIRYLRTFDALGVAGVFGGGGVGTAGPGTILRFDGIYGIKVLNPAWIVRIRA
jgi:hypothetical protein